MKDSLKKIFSRSFDQICFVVRDIEQAIEYWRQPTGIDAGNVAYDLALHQTEKEYYGKPGDFQFSCGYGYAGETLIELARHDGGDSVYNDWIQSGQKGPHHVGFRLTTPEDYAEAEQHYQQAGLVNAMASSFSGPFADCRCSVRAPQTPFFPNSLRCEQMLDLEIPGQEGLEVFDGSRGRQCL